MTRVVVTGGSGKAGRAVVDDLVASGYEVLNVDISAHPRDDAQFLNADVTDFGQTISAFEGADSIVHLAAIPAPGLRPPEVTFQINMSSTYNVFKAAATLGIHRVVWASSETTLGLPFERQPPLFAPIDESHTLFPESSYALSKVLSEEMARQFHRWNGTTLVGLRFSNIMEPHDYSRFANWQDDVSLRKWNLFGYVDARDVAQSCRLGLEADFSGAESFIIAADDTVMKRPSAELMAEAFPGVELRELPHERATLLGITKARRLLGYAPAYSWMDQIS